jgi:hypothetical protein
MAQHWYHTEATIKYMQIYLEEFHRQKDVFSRICPSKSTMKVLKALEMLLTWNKQEKWDIDPTWNDLSSAAKGHFVDEDITQIQSEIAQHHVHKPDFNFVMMHFLNHFADHIR